MERLLPTELIDYIHVINVKHAHKDVMLELLKTIKHSCLTFDECCIFFYGESHHKRRYVKYHFGLIDEFGLYKNILYVSAAAHGDGDQTHVHVIFDSPTDNKTSIYFSSK
jgi:hypothetical protein